MNKTHKRDEAKEAVNEVQMVAFILENEEFAVNIHQVREVLKLTKITPLPRSLEFVEGVINLRGEVIPVLDLRKRFGITETKRDEESRIIIVEVNGNDVGLIVDSVTEVIRMPENEIHEAPGNVAGARTDLIKAVGKKDDRLIIILELEKILTSEEQIALEEITLTEDQAGTS